MAFMNLIMTGGAGGNTGAGAGAGAEGCGGIAAGMGIVAGITPEGIGIPGCIG